MPMTMVVTRNVSDRLRGLLASSMLELQAGVYSSPRMSVSVRERLWSVISDWWGSEREASIIMVWADTTEPCGQSVRTLGTTPVDLVELDGLIVARRALRRH